MTQKELLLLREARNRYQREWRAKNREKVRGYLETYWLKKAKLMQLNPSDESESSD